jgi:hypothetical protein
MTRTKLRNSRDWHGTVESAKVIDVRGIHYVTIDLAVVTGQGFYPSSP